jgi:hypothetical protein
MFCLFGIFDNYLIFLAFLKKHQNLSLKKHKYIDPFSCIMGKNCVFHIYEFKTIELAKIMCLNNKLKRSEKMFFEKQTGNPNSLKTFFLE